jgi:AcrR family transcriptional regulator
MSNDRKPTREKVLDVAEKLFAEYGFAGVSVRDITEQADVRLASINYHFGSKGQLFDEVIGRRAHALSEARKQALEAINFDSLDKEEALEAVLRAFVEPMLRQRLTGGPGWKNYCRLIAQQAVLRNNRRLTSRFFDERALEFVAALKRADASLSDRQAHYAFQFLVGTTLYVFAENGRLDILSDKSFKSSDMTAICDELLPFLKGGLGGMTA